MRKKKIITCAGYHGTGSSAIGDLLKEIPIIENFGEEEYRFLQDPNGVGDLEEKILKNNSRLNSDRAIYDFKKYIKFISKYRGIYFWKPNIYERTFNKKFEKLSNEFMNEIVDISWEGYWYDFVRRNKFEEIKDCVITILCWIIRKFFCKDIKYRKELFLKKKVFFSYPIDFSKKVKKYLNNLFDTINTEKDILFFDQLVPCCNIDKYLKYFDNIKVIVVDRDPRDIYVLSKFIWKDGVIPVDNIEKYIVYWKAIRKHLEYEKENRENILRINFEDLVYNYEKTVDKILNFLQIDKKEHKNHKKFFIPEKSINNTQIYLRYKEVYSDIKLIEKELEEYCYKFPYLNKINNKEKVF